jgi:hypothetical protein
MDEAAQAAGGAAPELELMTEDDLLDWAQKAMGRAVAQPRGSIGWIVQWAAYDTYAGELGRRAVRFVACRNGS